jgi:peptidyl-prolyl cis-trans isomerase A (cyclophilin A)
VNRLFLVFLFCVALVFAPRVTPGQAPSPSSQSSQTPAPAAKPPVHHATAAHTGVDPALFHPATLHAKAPDVFQVKFTTTKGDFVIEATRAWAPNGVDRFYNLVKHGYFNGVSFYRVVPGFIVQFGLSPDPKITAAWNAASIKDDPVKEHNAPGYVTYAMGGPNTRSNQLFINFADNSSQLDGMGFAPIGQVTSGMDVVKNFYSAYGELSDPGLNGTGPSQERAMEAGKAYLDKNYPLLDSIKSTEIISQTPPPGTPAKRTSSTTATTKKPAAASATPQN